MVKGHNSIQYPPNNLPKKINNSRNSDLYTKENKNVKLIREKILNSTNASK